MPHFAYLFIFCADLLFIFCADLSMQRSFWLEKSINSFKIGRCSGDHSFVLWAGTSRLSIFHQHIYVPQPKGVTYCFWCGSRRRQRRRPRSFVSARYLLNRWTDSDQTCTDTLLGMRNELIRFW